MRSEKINWNKEVKEKPEREQLKELQKHIKNRKHGDSRDGFIETWRKKYKYNGIAFELAILRYFDHTNKFKPITPGRICDRHVVVEFLEETRELAEQVDDLYIEDFLYHDTLHAWNNDQPLIVQLQEAYELAISDIEELPKRIKKEIKRLEKKLEILKDLLEEVKEDE